MGKAKTRLYVGVDVGGTNIGAALVQSEGGIVASHRNRTPLGGTCEETVAVILQTIEELLAEADTSPADLKAIGLGVAGTINPAEGLVMFSPNTGISGVNLIKPVEEKFGVKTVMGNDVNVATLGEAWLGAAQGARSVVGIFVGTGIGGGIIMDGKLVIGTRLAAGEIGHIRVQNGGAKCGCGSRGCFEALASRTAMERDIRKAVKKGKTTILTKILDGKLEQIKSKALRKALKKKDPLVTGIIKRASVVIGNACLTVRHMLDPEVIVLGGGVIEACDKYMTPTIQRIVKKGSMPGAESDARVVVSTLGDDAGMLGAVALAIQEVG
jgi:glucokinase